MPTKAAGVWFEVATTLGQEIPGVKSILEWNDKMPMDPLQEIFVGDAPKGADPRTSRSRVRRRCSMPSPQQLLSNNIGNAAFFEEAGLSIPPPAS